ncbi:hypothetical protein [Haloarchaeobius sp. TZWWS8]|uniref:hypothetical protein n=1 Tax=Haloarchaeobius sp. TZWWS8 TaxID=3446121 RepID=UPI003EBF0C6F
MVVGGFFVLFGMSWLVGWAAAPPAPYDPVLTVGPAGVAFDGFGGSVPGLAALLGMGPVAIGVVLFVTGWVESTANRL